MRDLIDSILIGGMATYFPFWIWDNSRDQIMGAFTDTAEKFISNCVRTDSDGNSTNPEQLH